MLTHLRSIIQDETASAILEYGLLIAAVAALAIVSIQTFGWSLPR
jgi:Flp pilus assembly pilin Flp